MKDVEKMVDSNGVVMQIVDGAARDMIAAEYDETASYAVGDYCIYNDHYYKCNTAIPSGGETWDATHWDATTLGAEDKEIKSSLSDEILWNDSKYTSGDIQLSSPLKNGDHIMLIFKGLSSAYIQQFPFIIDTTLSQYLQIGFWGESTQYCRYRMQVANNSTTFTINEVINGNAGSALLRIVRTKKAI